MILQESGEEKARARSRLYRYGLKKLISYLGDVEIESITKEDLQRFFRYLRTDTSLCEATIAVVWRGVRIMFRWAAAELAQKGLTKTSVSKICVKGGQVIYREEVYQLLKSVKEGEGTMRATTQ